MLMTETDARESQGTVSATVQFLRSLIVRYCDTDDLRTHDPYDIWQTRIGFLIKDGYNRHGYLGLAPAAAGALLDNFCNERLRSLYRPKEYAIVRAFAALCLGKLSRATGEKRWAAKAVRHLHWLADHSCTGFSGPCWGLGFRHAATRDLIYDANTPFSVITPYAMEAFASFADEPDGEEWRPFVRRIFSFFKHDIQVMEEDDEVLATSYGPFHDRTVVNAVSYNLFSHAMYLRYAPKSQIQELHQKIGKMYAYLRKQQRNDGSWLYSPHGRPFIDCFHSCIVLKNIVKANRLTKLEGAQDIVAVGYEYVTKSFFDEGSFLFKRFALRNKPGLVRFDLYDNAEVLQLAILVGDRSLTQSLIESILTHFYAEGHFYSEIDFLGVRRKRDMLRWAVMPFLYAVSLLLEQETERRWAR